MLKTFQLKPMMENRIDSSKGEEARMMRPLGLAVR
jgi:hypothetical protein